MDLSAFVAFNVPDYNYKNYYVNGGYAYTEDHVMVHKLFVYKIPPESNVYKVHEYFSQFGNVKNVRFVSDKDADYPYVAFVQFESPTAAARVLNFYHKSHVDVTKALYLVKVCDSWHQPNCQSTKEILLSNCSEEDQFLPPNRDSILVLNDDCLEMIIRLLPISSQLHFARSCSRICQVFQMTSKSLYRTLFLERLANMTQWQIRDFFDFTGDYIIRIEGKLKRENHQRILNSMSTFCNNIEELDLDSSVVLRSGNDTFLKLIRKLRKLKTLKLSEAFELSGRHLSNLSPTIESLSLRDCFSEVDTHIISLCKSLNNLKELNFGRWLYCTDAVVNALAWKCENLETLTVGINQSDYGLIAKLPKLKNLTVIMSMRYNSCSTIFTQLVEHKSHQLKFLCIDGTDCVSDNDAQQISRLNALRILNCKGNSGLTDKGLKYFCDLEHLEEINLRKCENITNNALINLVLNCKKLKRVNIEGCYLISNNLIFDLIQKMKEQIQNKTFMRTEPALLMVRFTNIQKNILNDPEYKASSHLVIVDL